MKVLVVEDDAETAAYIVNGLIEHGHVVDHARSGHDGLFGNIAIWLMNGGQVSSVTLIGNVPTRWSIVGTGDFNGDGKIDILWRDTNGNVAIWLLDPFEQVAVSLYVATVPTTWSIAETGDFDGDGKSDILWRDTGGNVAIWLMNGGTVASNLFVSNVSTSWSIQGANAD